LGDGALNYITDFWNINDLIRLLVTCIYCYLRLNIFGTNSYDKSFILIKNIGFEETHIESEIILDDLENSFN